MLSDCSYCWNTPCTCGKIYDDDAFKDEVLFDVKQQIEKILFKRSSERAEAIKILDAHSKKVSDYIAWDINNPK